MNYKRNKKKGICDESAVVLLSYTFGNLLLFTKYMLCEVLYEHSVRKYSSIFF